MKLGRKSQKKKQKTHGIRWENEDKKLEMRLGRDGVWWEKGNTENEVGDRGMESGGRKGIQRMRLGIEGWSLVGEREHRK